MAENGGILYSVAEKFSGCAFGRTQRSDGVRWIAVPAPDDAGTGEGQGWNMKDGFVRVAAATPEIRVADCAHNGEKILELVRSAPENTALMVFPELCVTGYTCGDLFAQPLLLQSAEEAVRRLLDSTVDCDALLLVGVPVACGTALYNCAAVCHRGNLLGLVPKSHLPNYAEFYGSPCKPSVQHFLTSPANSSGTRLFPS